MLSDRPDAQELLDLLGFESADWRQYYQDLWARYPTLSEDWVHVGFLNLPKRRVVDKRESHWFKRWQSAAAERNQAGPAHGGRDPSQVQGALGATRSCKSQEAEGPGPPTGGARPSAELSRRNQHPSEGATRAPKAIRRASSAARRSSRRGEAGGGDRSTVSACSPDTLPAPH